MNSHILLSKKTSNKEKIVLKVILKKIKTKLKNSSLYLSKEELGEKK